MTAPTPEARAACEAIEDAADEWAFWCQACAGSHSDATTASERQTRAYMRAAIASEIRDAANSATPLRWPSLTACTIANGEIS